MKINDKVFCLKAVDNPAKKAITHGEGIFVGRFYPETYTGSGEMHKYPRKEAYFRLRNGKFIWESSCKVYPPKSFYGLPNDYEIIEEDWKGGEPRPLDSKGQLVEL